MYCKRCNIEIPQGYILTEVEGGCLCARCTIEGNPERIRQEHYVEGKICHRCGEVARKAQQLNDHWGLTEDPSDLTSPRGVMRQLCRKCLETVILNHVGTNEPLIARLHMWRADCSVMIGEGYTTSFQATVVDCSFAEPPANHFEFLRWNNERVLVVMSRGGDCFIAHLVRPIVP